MPRVIVDFDGSLFVALSSARYVDVFAAIKSVRLTRARARGGGSGGDGGEKGRKAAPTRPQGVFRQPCVSREGKKKKNILSSIYELDARDRSRELRFPPFRGRNTWLLLKIGNFIAPSRRVRTRVSKIRSRERYVTDREAGFKRRGLDGWSPEPATIINIRINSRARVYTSKNLSSATFARVLLFSYGYLLRARSCSISE